MFIFVILRGFIIKKNFCANCVLEWMLREYRNYDIVLKIDFVDEHEIKVFEIILECILFLINMTFLFFYKQSADDSYGSDWVAKPPFRFKLFLK